MAAMLPSPHATPARRAVPGARRLLGAAVLAVALGAAACSDQDPGLDPATDGPGTTAPRVTFGPCPPGGPDDTTPAAGCLDDDGTVLRP